MSVPDSAAQRAFIEQIAPGAIAAQRQYGVPASVTIAQAIEESGWGRSKLATRDHNLFGIKGTGPAGSDAQPTREYENGRSVTRIASFRVYHTAAQSIDDHGNLLATSEYYRQAMAVRGDPNAFAAALTGVYATDPHYGAKLIDLMGRFDLYRYDVAAPDVTPRTAMSRPAAPAARAPGTGTPQAGTPQAATPRARTPGLPASPAGAPGPLPPGSASRGPVIPGVARARNTPSPTSAGRAATGRAPGAATIPGVPSATPAPLAGVSSPVPTAAAPARPGSGSPASSEAPQTQTVSARPVTAQTPPGQRAPARAAPPPEAAPASPYRPQMPASVRDAFLTTAKRRLVRAEPLYQAVAREVGIPWQVLAACDWMQCEAQKRYSPVHGERLGTLNPDGTVYRTKSEALEQCADDLVRLARAVYQTDLTAAGPLSVLDLANVFAAFRWGALLRLHHTSAMEFPYSVAGLTALHTKMRWPNIDEPNAPDKPGGRCRVQFGAVPVVLCLNYPATA